MNRRATLGMSLVRIGHAVGALCLLFILPILPFVAVSALVRPDADAPEPTYRPSCAE